LGGKKQDSLGVTSHARQMDVWRGRRREKKKRGDGGRRDHTRFRGGRTVVFALSKGHQQSPCARRDEPYVREDVQKKGKGGAIWDREGTFGGKKSLLFYELCLPWCAGPQKRKNGGRGTLDRINVDKWLYY